ncbi:MAG: hypothetical protein GY716_03740 [bacterium]|nr:hypothetical protein [bacterium]
MTAKDQLMRLYRIQDLVLRIRAAQTVVNEAPQKVEEIEARFRERNAEYVSVKERFDELKLDQRTREAELQDLEEHKKKFTDDLMQVKNQREYAAMLKEIDSVKAQISEHEDSILADMDEIKKLEGELETHTEHIEQERKAVETERSEVERQEVEARGEIERLGSERDGIESDLPTPVLEAVRRLELRRQGIFLSKADNGTCMSCFVRVRPQVFQEIKTASQVHSCGNCRRFLYFEPSLAPKPEPEPKPEAGAAADSVETVNDGAV